MYHIMLYTMSVPVVASGNVRYINVHAFGASEEIHQVILKLWSGCRTSSAQESGITPASPKRIPFIFGGTFACTLN